MFLTPCLEMVRREWPDLGVWAIHAFALLGARGHLQPVPSLGDLRQRHLGSTNDSLLRVPELWWVSKIVMEPVGMTKACPAGSESQGRAGGACFPAPTGVRCGPESENCWQS